MTAAAPDRDDNSEFDSRRRWLWAAAVVSSGVCGWLEVLRLRHIVDEGDSVIAFLLYWDMETTLPFVVLLLLPILIWLRSSKQRRTPSSPRAAVAVSSPTLPWTVMDCVVIGGISICCSWQIGSQQFPIKTSQGTQQFAFTDLPPAYHDEYSYLLQARTFLDARLSYPPMAVRPDLFHQFHVLNEHRTVSRYFPWTGLWIAPFEAIGHPFWGHWLAGGLVAVFFYLSMRQLTSRPTALLAGILIAVSPGLAVFSNLLLAHHPTMLALSVFTFSFLQMMTTLRLRWAFAAGIALTLAMLGRPMTAAGFALPFGVWLAATLFRRTPGEVTTQPCFSSCRRLVLGFAIPLACGFAALAVLNHDATGRWTRTAYQEYAERYTPRHRYGFGNGKETSQVKGPAAIEEYNNWATNLTPAAAAQNVWSRFSNSLVWSLSSIPILFGLIVTSRLIATASPEPDIQSIGRTGLRLLAWAIVSLHLVHVPYWYDGIMHWHYVFETAPLLLMLTATGLADTVRTLSRWINPRLAFAWVGMLIGVGLLPGWISLPEFGDTSKVAAAVSEQSFSRTRFAYFNRVVRAPTFTRPALVLVDETDSDPQLSYIINPPDLDAPVIVCRRPETEREIDELRQTFSNRTLYVFNPGTLRFTEVPVDARL